MSDLLKSLVVGIAGNFIAAVLFDAFKRWLKK